MKAINLYIAFCFIITSSLVSSDDIPAMLWNIRGNSLAITPVSALGDNNPVLKMNIKEALHKESCILVFAVNKLSLEDFYDNNKPTVKNNTLHNMESFLDSHPYMLLSVEDPLNYIHKAHCGVQEIVVDNKIDDNVLQAVSKAMQRSCIVILHVSDDGIVPENGKLQNVFMPSFENSKNIVGMITGVKSSWSGSDSEHHMFRNLLQTETSDSNNFVNYTGCIIMYAENGTITVEKENTTALSFSDVNTDGSSCNNDSSVLNLVFKTSGPLDSVTLTLNFNKSRSSWRTEATVSMTGDKAIPEQVLDSKFVEAPLGFSFSCGKLVLKGKNDTISVEIVIERFQIQPFEVNNKAFQESFDCVPYFTIPIWMGVFVSILFIAILNVGIYALFSVHTMDRFDDPKGKSISVGAAAD